MCWIWESGCNGDQYAAWTQAAGSILALMVAIAIAYYQGNRERIHRERDANERHLCQLRSIFFLAEAMHQLLVEFKESNPAGMYDKAAYTEAVGDLLQAMRIHPSDLLTDEQRTSYFVLRRRFSQIFGHVHFGDELVYLDVHIKQMWDLVVTFGAYLPSQSPRSDVPV